LEAFGMKVEYFELRRATDLALPKNDEKSFVILIAVWLGKARLIDNIAIDL
jgi:Panthothenate synthetase